MTRKKLMYRTFALAATGSRVLSRATACSELPVTVMLSRNGLVRAPRGAGRSADVGQAKIPGDDHPLHLRAALTDLQHLGVAVEAGDRVLIHIAVPAEDVGGVTRVVHARRRGKHRVDRRLLFGR